MVNSIQNTEVTGEPDEFISVLSLNLRFGLADDGPNSWKHRKKAFPSMLKSLPADFIGFQEANNFQTDDLNRLLVDYDYIGKRDPAPDFWQNNIIFFKKTWECTFYEHLFLSPTPLIPSRFRQSKWPRQCTIGIFKNNRRKLICVNTHLDFDRSVQIESAKLIMKRLSDLPPGLPAILFGDFNTTPDSFCHRVFTTPDPRLGNEEGLRFSNAFREPYPGTHHGFTGDTRGDHIDWILFHGGIRVKSCEAFQEPISGMYPSDHFPLYATFKWEK